MNLHHVIAYIFTELCGFPVRFDDLVDQFFGHFAYMSRRHVDLAGTIGNTGFTDITADRSESTVHTAVGQLDVGESTCVVDAAGAFGQALAYAEGVELKLFVV